ncbi:MAG: hypothetical protein PHP74_03720 [Candidatus Gracilibacteria bacterium]|nr:hypothetical protein [Candidatus Gracilibacteria bacterium]
MTDNNTQTNSSTSTSTATTTDDIVVDKNKSPEQYMADAAGKYIIPGLVREKFPDLVKLIYETESMNTEEREYWMQILPIMTEEQIVKFRDILVNEKNELSKLDQDYQNEMARLNKNRPQEIDEEALKGKITQIQEKEKEHERSEKEAEEEILKKLEEL